MSGPSLELAGGGDGDDPGRRVPPPLPPDDPEAWYAPDVRAQYEVHPGVVATITETGREFRYRVREPSLSGAGAADLGRVREYFADAHAERPRTREGAIERMAAGFGEKYRRVIDRLVETSPATRRRLDYHALAELRCLDELTPYALDERIEVADASDDRLVVHTSDYAPAVTDLPSDPEYLDRFVSERVDRHTVPFHGFEVPVVIYREHVLGTDPFATKYAVQEPDLLPGDEQLVAECKERIWGTNVDGVVADPASFVRERARELLSRRLTARNTRAWREALSYRLRAALAEYGLAVPPVDRRFSDDRLSDLVYYVLRDYVGYGKLTVPIRDPTLEDIEANRVGERVKVVPRAEVGHNERIPTNLTFEDEASFVNVVTQLAAADGTELNASQPSAKVNLRPAGTSAASGTASREFDETIRCAVALPTISEDGPHISIRKQAPDVLTPVDLIEDGSISTELVTLLWLLYEHRGVVLFSGPTGVGKTTLMNAHMPFIPYDERPISIDEGSREVRLPHETGVSLTTRDHESEYKRVSMSDLMTEANYLNPDVEVIAEINTPASFETFAESLNTGHGIVGTTHAEDVRTLINRIVEQGLPAYLTREIDLVVFPRHVGGERYVGRVVELLAEDEFEALEGDDASGTLRKDGTAIHWNRVATRTHEGAFEHAHDRAVTGGGPDPPGGEVGADAVAGRTRIFHRIADRTDRSPGAILSEYRRKHRYVEYLRQEGMADFGDLFEFLADLRTNEAATVERAVRRAEGTTVPRGADLEIEGGHGGREDDG